MLNGWAVSGVLGRFCRGFFCVRQRFGGVERDGERVILGGDVYGEALVEEGFDLVVEFAGNGDVDAFILVDVFVAEVAFLCKPMIDRDRVALGSHDRHSHVLRADV